VGARILKILSDLQLAEAEHSSRRAAFASIAAKGNVYDPELLLYIGRLLNCSPSSSEVIEVHGEIELRRLRPGHVLAGNVESVEGMLLLLSGQTITSQLLERVLNFARTSGVREPILIRQSEEVRQPV
jgi:hypothetical protein